MKQIYIKPEMQSNIAEFEPMLISTSETPYNGEEVLSKEESLSEEELYEIFLGWD